MRRSLVAAAFFAAVAAWPAPAHATLYPGLTIAPGQTVTKSYPAIPGTNRRQAHTPTDCSTEPRETGCDVIPVTLAVSKASLKTVQYTINASLTWQTQSINNGATGNEQPTQLNFYLWEDPPAAQTSSGSPSYDSAAEGAAPPAQVTVVSPKSLKLDLVVTSVTAPDNGGYTISVSMTGSPEAPVDRSVETAPPDLSNTSNFAVTPSADSTTTTVTPGTAPTTQAVGAPTGTPLADVASSGDSQLDGLKPISDEFGVGVAKHVSSSHSKSGPPGPISAWEVVAALVALPALIIGGMTYAWRRRVTTST